MGRNLLGNQSYELSTMDKLIAHILKQLQSMANDNVLQNMIEIYRRHELAGKIKPSAFQICNMAKTDQKICHCEFLGVILEEEEDDEGGENCDSNKREIDDVEDTDDGAQASKRPKRA